MKKYFAVLILFIFLYNQGKAGIKGHPMNPKNYVGNVSGIVLDKENFKPLSGVEVYITNISDKLKKRNSEITELNNPLIDKFKSERITNASGKFLINFVPTPDSGITYSVLVKAIGYESQLIKDFFVPPGALTSPKLTILLKKGKGALKIIENKELSSIITYGQDITNEYLENTKLSNKKNKLPRISTIGPWIYATDEGLVGFTTANAHVILPKDHFCALPSSSVLNSSDQSSAFNVTLDYGSNKQISVPVWDIGPWNIHDNYWDPESQRTIYQYLNQGGKPGLDQYHPEVQAAYYDNYNLGYSEPMGSNYPNGRTPNNPNGIDLADGTFNDLGLSSNDWIRVTFNWQNTNSVVNEDIKQIEDWFGSVTVAAKDNGATDIHITNGQTVDVLSGCNLTLNTNIRFTVDAGATLIFESGMIKNFAAGAGVDVASGGTFTDYTVTGICNTCPPFAPSNLSATIVGQNIVLRWDAYTDQSAWGLQIYKNSQSYGNWMQTTQTSYTDVNAVNALPATYQISAFNNYGNSFSNTINIIVSPSIISTNTPWNGVVYVNSNVTVASGTELNIGNNTKIIFNAGNGYNLIINGTLFAQGIIDNPVTFMSNSTSPSSGDWGSIIFSDTGAANSILDYASVNYGNEIQFTNGANATIENSTIQNCTEGIYVSNSSPTILNNQIIDPQENGIYIDASINNPIVKNNLIKKNSSNQYYYNYQGIYITNNSTPNIAHNEISGFDWGIYVGGGSNIRCSGSDIWNQNNLIVNNYFGLASGWGSYVDAGYQGTYGYNSIHNNINYDVYCYKNSYLYSEYNWWGGSLPLHYVDGTSTLDVNNRLSSDPWNGVMPKIAGSYSSSKSEIASSKSTQSVSDSSAVDIAVGYAFEDAGKIDEAIAYYKNMVAKDTFTGFALTELAKLENKYSRSDILTYLESLLPNTNHYTLASNLIADIYLQSRQFDKAISICDNIISNYPNDFQSINSKFAKLFAFINYKNDFTKAHQILTGIKSMNLTDENWTPRIAMADYLLGLPYNGMVKKSAGFNNYVPKLYLLSQNYPNPFNPTTIIHYEIPNDGLVILKIYDELGREVKTLVNQFEGKGKYDINFEASNLASGIYFYRLQSGSFISTKRMVLLK